MGYRFERDEPIPSAVHRIAREQLDEALDGLAHPDAKGHVETVHDVRKACKKLRGLVRLVRPGLGEEYARANAAFRDAARELSPIRDAHALEATFSALVAAHPGAAPKGVRAVERALRERAEAATASIDDGDELIARAAALLRGAEARIDDWQLDDDPSLLAAGSATTYGRGRRAFRSALEAPSAEALHEWRKRAKYAWYHVRLLEPAAPSVLGPLSDRFHDLSDSLGDEHDLAVLVDALRAAPDEHGGEEAAQAAILVAEARRADLRERAFRLGARLYVETAKAYARRLTGYREAWHAHGDELPAGEIGSLAAE